MIPENTRELTRTVETLFSAGDVVELRMFKDGATFSGYFDDHQELVAEAAKYDERDSDIYITFNKLPEEICYRRYNRVERMKGQGASTSDKDVERRVFLFIDADCDRVAGISSTEKQKRQSREKILEIRDYLRAQSWPEPILCDSGNGYHLLYRIDLPNDRASLELVAGVLEALDFKFTDDAIKVDTSTKNAARITKFYGSTAKKGDDLPKRPHRPSKILEAPQERSLVSREQLLAVAAMKPEAARKFKVYDGGREYGGFDVSEWIAKHNVPVKREGPWDGDGYRWILEKCIWNGHTDNSAYIIQGGGGWIAAGCQHNSCPGGPGDNGWPEVRKHYEPDAYDRKDSGGERSAGGESFADGEDAFQDLADLPDPEEFPLHALPITVRRFVREAAASEQRPV